MAKRPAKTDTSPVIENRRARYDYHILDTLECGIKLTGTEIKSIRNGQASLAEGFVRVEGDPRKDEHTLILHQVNIPEYPPAGPSGQHEPTRKRRLLAHKREILKLRKQTDQKGVTLIPLKIYFVRGFAKVLIGVAQGKGKADKRADIAKRDTERDIRRAMSRKL